MAIDKIQGPKTPDKMLQIRNFQKALLSGSIFDDPNDDKDPESSTIHSGHFMVSRVHEEKEDDDDDEVPTCSDDSKDFSVPLGYDFVQANKSTSHTYNFGPKSTQTLSIDASLTKLFECMTLAYSGKITSPKWKPFRGMHLTVKDKVRLNNIIWREWHMQYIFMKRSIVCQFATPLSDYIHTKPEAVVLEGKYWKRRLDTVTKEYKKWRRYYRDQILQTMPEAPSLFSPSREHLSEMELLERVKDVSAMPRNVQQSSTDLTLLNADLMDMDFTDNLFSTLNQPFAFPNPRDIGQMTCADLIQPGLVQLQPNLEDFMDIDFSPDFLSARPAAANSNPFAQASEQTSLLGELGSHIDMNQSNLHIPQQMSHSVMGLLDPSIFTSISNTAGINMLTALAALTSSNLHHLPPSHSQQQHHHAPTPTPAAVAAPVATVTSHTPAATATTASHFHSDSHMMVVDDSSLSSSSTKQGFGGFLGTGSGGGVKHMSPPSPQSLSSSLSSPPHTQTVNTAGLGLTLSQSPRLPSPSSSSPRVVSPSATVRGQQQQSRTVKGQAGGKVTSRTVSPSGSPVSVARAGGVTVVAAKKDGFAVPQGKPATTTPRKPRNIAPAPSPPSPTPTSPSPSVQSTYLAQLLTNGTYPGAIFSVKKEPSPTPAAPAVSVATSNYTPILPAVSRPVVVGGSQPGGGDRLSLFPPHSSSTRSPLSAPTTPTPTPTPSISVSSPALKLPTEFTMEINKVRSVDFPTSVLLAAASSALGTTSSNLKDALRMSPSNNVTAAMASASEMSLTQASSPRQRSPMPMSLSHSPAPTPPPPASPLAAVFSEALTPIPGLSSAVSLSPYQPSSSPPFNPFSLDEGRGDGMKEEGLGKGLRMGVHTEQRRVAHLSSEQKRRCNLKSGFDLLHTLVPTLAQNPKVSKATMLQKTAEHCRKMKSERLQMQQEASILKQEIESLNNAIGVVQSQLPETGVPVTRQRVDQMKDMFEEYVRSRTLQNWKFWIFSIIIRPLFDTYNNMVSTANVEELCRTTAAWLDQHCSLVTLRPTVLNALRHLSMSTSILTEPQRVQEQATQAVTKGKVTKSPHSSS